VRRLVVVLLLANCLAVAEEMPTGTTQYHFAQFVFIKLGAVSVDCEDEVEGAQLACATYDFSFRAFRPGWEAFAESSEAPLQLERMTAWQQVSPVQYGTTYRSGDDALFVVFTERDRGGYFFIAFLEDHAR
jgi:hypothetical protein